MSVTPTPRHWTCDNTTEEPQTLRTGEFTPYGNVVGTTLTGAFCGASETFCSFHEMRSGSESQLLAAFDLNFRL